ncbi:leucine-rich repeat protein [Coriobacterium glomerans]|uniref:leucine-rich repeat protein n=1 Tax=Coriobacterium glomerans TaxID=33871 RepID=UPI002478EE5B|nr:leucine-rich repeat protein [Coriobacterium glomerans]
MNEVGMDAFYGCKYLKSTGLAGNTSITILSWECYDGCTALTSTGLEDNASITTILGTAFADCTDLQMTGLARNKTLTSLGGYTFWRCPHIKSTGLDGNTSVSTIGALAFNGCFDLGTESTKTANARDLVINQPMHGDKPVGLVLGTHPDPEVSDGNVFSGTAFTSLYLLCDKSLLTITDNALEGSAITRIFVNSSWLGTEEFSNGGRTYRISDGTLVIMDPLQSVSAARTTGTSDGATAIVCTSRSAVVEIVDSGGVRLASREISIDETAPPQRSALDIPSGSGLSPSADRLSAHLISSGPFAYPTDVDRRLPYNTVEAAERSCELPAVSYTVAFDGNGATAGATPSTTMVYDVPSRLTMNGFSWAHRAFAGWTSEKDGTGPGFADGQSVTNLTDVQDATVTLYAKWTSTISIALEVRSQEADAGTLLPGAGYVISRDRDVSRRDLWVTGLFVDPEKKTEATWPQMSGVDGEVRLYGLPMGTFYLLNSSAPAGYQDSAKATSIAIDEDGGIIVDDKPYTPTTPDSISVAVAFGRAPRLPGTGAATADGLRAAGVAAAALSAAVPVGLLLVGRARRAG